MSPTPRWKRILWSALPLLLLALAAFAATPRAARAQTCLIPDPSNPSCPPAGQQGPSVFITPEGGAFLDRVVQVTIEWCDDYPLAATARSVTLNGQPVSSTWSGAGFGDCGNMYTSSLSVTLVSGENTLRASITDSHSQTTTATAVYTYGLVGPAVAVTPDGATATRVPGERATETFTVQNPGSTEATFTLQGVCSDGPVTGCTASRTTLTLAPGASAPVGVSYMVSAYFEGMLGAPGGNVVWLKAWKSSDATKRDSGSVAVSVDTEPRPAGSVGEVGDDTRLDRGGCVVAAAGSAAAFECGDLRLVHALPTTRVLNTVRTPVLVYNSRHAAPRPVVAMHWAPQPAETWPAPYVTEARAVVRLAQGTTATRTWTGLQIYEPAGYDIPPVPYRFAVPVNASSLATGVYDYTFELTVVYSDGRVVLEASSPGRLVVVNRAASPFGAGWWLAGVESLVGLATGEKLWVGGDGSTRVYRPTGAANTWVADAHDRPDTLRWQPDSAQYVRTLPHRVEVRFDGAGRHVRTRNRAGHWSTFEWNTSTNQLVRLHLPRAQSFNTGYVYTFEYNNPGGKLSSVVAPIAAAGQNRTVQVAADAGGRVTRITDPDLRYVELGYAAGSTSPEVRSRTDRRRLSTTTFDFDAGGRLSRAAETMGTAATGDDVVRSFQSAESRGVATPVADADQYTLIDGPRPDSDVLDHTRIWVNRWGAPTRVRDALGQTTWLYRRDPAWPALVTSIQYPNRRVVSATYDRRGNLAASTDWGTQAADGRYATTLYEWDPFWDAVTRVTAPEGEVARTQYNAQGQVEWTEQGTDGTRRVTFAYRPATDAQAPGLVASVTEPGSHTQTFGYGPLGNLSSVTTPLGSYSDMLSDAAGRIIRTRTLADAARGLYQSDTTVYDAADQAVRTESFGPQAFNGSGVMVADSQRVVVETEYDEEGNVLAVSRRSRPDPAGIGTVTTRWKHDAVGRRTAEIAPDATPATWDDNPRDTTAYNPAGLAVWTLTRRGDTLRTRYDALGRALVRYHSAVRYDSTSQGIPRAYGSTLPPGCSTHFSTQYLQHTYPAYPNDVNCGLRIAADSAVFAYDVMGNLTRADNADAQVRRSYFANGLLKTDTLRIQTLERSDWARHVYVTGYAYDLNGRRTSLTHPTQLAPAAGAATSYAYDPATGAVARVTDPLGNAFGYTYDARGLLDVLTLPAGMLHDYTYDADGRLSHYRLQVPSVSSSLASVTNTYDVRGKLTRSSNTGGGQETMTAVYSGLGHLVNNQQSSTAQTQFGIQASNSTSSDMRYDALANSYYTVGSTTVTTSTGRSWDSRNGGSNFEALTGRQTTAWTAQNTTRFTYDRAGNQVFQAETSTQNPSYGVDRASYYGGDGRLRAIDMRTRVTLNGEETGVWEEYRYDALGRRVWVRTLRWCAGSSDPQRCNFDTVRRTVWDGDDVLYEIQMDDTERENDGQPAFHPRATTFDPNPMLGRVLYTHGPGIDQPLSVIRMGLATYPSGTSYRTWPAFAAIPLWGSSGRAPYVTFADGTRSLCQFVPGEGQRCLGTFWLLAWNAYGKRNNGAIISAGGYEEVWLGGVMEDQQDASGLLYRRNRYYDPATGRFTQEDPIGLAGGLNVYGFANGDPVTYSDPYGLEAEEADIIIQGGGIVRGLVRVIGRALARRAARAAMRRAARSVDELEEGLRASGGAVRGMRAPPHPAGSASRNDFGENMMKWGTGHAEARARIGTLTREELEKAGVTREMARQWRDFYVNEAVLRPSNPSARGRAELMHRAMELLQ